MRLRSLDSLDIAKAWAHTLWWARRRIDVPDRLPFEVWDRLSPHGPTLTEDHHLRPVIMVMATKGSGTVRPFARISAPDLTLYQALVDALAPTIEDALGPRTKVFAYRQSLAEDANAFDGSPQWSDFMASVRVILESGDYEFALSADISNYFLYIDVDELERRLLSAGGIAEVVIDLGALLRGWQALGVRGLPQGVPPSSPLGNFYLASLDQAISVAGFEHRRYMDDHWVFAHSYQSARRAQDLIERHLFEVALGLGGEKSKIRRRETALYDATTAEQVIENRKAAHRAEVEA